MATDSSQLPMSEKRRAILETCSEDLVKFMDLNIMIWARLISARVVSTVEKEKIVRSGIMEEQVAQFLALMTRKKDGDFDILVKCLEDNNQSHVAYVLREADASNAINQDTQSNMEEMTSQTTSTNLSEGSNSSRICPTPMKFYKAKKGESYDMAGERKGVAMIVNISKGKNQKSGKKWRRRGSKVDADNLEELFEDLKYDVEAYEDLTLSQFMGAMYSVAEKANKEDAKSLFVVLMSHGTQVEGKPAICSSDGVYFQVMEALRKVFGSENLTKLADRPKVFILQACKGEEVDCVEQEWTETETDASCCDEPKKRPPAPSFAHYLIANATQEEFAAHRDTSRGSWFIQEVVKVFREKAATKDITELLTEVRQNVWRNYMSQEGAIQTTEDLSTLGKKFYIFPGI